MREILFRGKVIGNLKCYKVGEWAFGDLIHDFDGNIVIITIHDGSPEWAGIVDKNTIGQFTGLLDKNGTKIFEGDIVNDWMGGAFKKDYVVKFSTDNVGSCGCCVPEFDGSGFVCEDDNGIRGRLDSNCEVIGNIHDKGE